MSSLIDGGSCSSCQARSRSAAATPAAARTARTPYHAGPGEWSAICAVATAWPAARAASRAATSVASRAAACAAKAAVRAAPTLTSPAAQARAVAIARRGRSSSGQRSSNKASTCSAQSAAQMASCRCRSRSSEPPRWMALKRSSLTRTPFVLPNEKSCRSQSLTIMGRAMSTSLWWGSGRLSLPEMLSLAVVVRRRRTTTARTGLRVRCPALPTLTWPCISWHVH